MSANTEKTVSATPIVVSAAESDTLTPEEAGKAREARAKRSADRDAAVLRWKAIVDAGGESAWITAELRAKGLFVDTDPSTLSESEKAGFKEAKRAEGVEKKKLAKLAIEARRATHIGYVGAGIFYSDDEDGDARAKDARAARAKENDLSTLDSPEALAKGLGVSLPALRWLAFHRDVETRSHYRRFTIPKRDGTARRITAPKPELKAAQKWLLRNVVEKLPVHGAAHGFLTGRSIATNASVHAGADVVVKVDVKDFFPTVTFRRVKGLFRKAGLPENVATLSALLATEPPREIVEFRGKTLLVAEGPRACPQGAPTSPAILNAMCLRLDLRMSGLARLLGFSYTRYADDLAFSFHGPKGKGSHATPIGYLLRGVTEILKGEGFRINPKKTTVMRSGNAQRVTGLVVNRPNREDVPLARVPRDVVRKLKAAIWNREHGKPGKGDESLAQLKGMAAFIHMADPKKGRAFLDRITALEARDEAPKAPRP